MKIKKLAALIKSTRWIALFSMDIIRAVIKSDQSKSIQIVNFAQESAVTNQLNRLSSTGGTAASAYKGFNRVQRFLRRHDCRPTRVLEIGTGPNLGILSLFLASTATKAYGVDIEPMNDRYNEGFYKAFREYMKAMGGFGWSGYFLERNPFPNYSFPDSNDRIDFHKLVNDVEYLAPCSSDKIPLPDNSIDLHYSSATMEHVPNANATIGEMRRLLVNGGLAVHEIDLSYHRHHPNPLALLTYPDEKWNKLTHRYGEGLGVEKIWDGTFKSEIYCNRLRTSDFVDLFETHGFEILEIKPHVRYGPQGLDLNSLDKQFAVKDIEDLAIIFVTIVARCRK